MQIRKLRRASAFWRPRRDLFYRPGHPGGRGRGDRRGGRHQQDDALPALLLQGRAGGGIPAPPRARDAGKLLGRAGGGASRAIRARNCAAGSQAMEAHVLDTDQRGCALANAAIELPEKDHPARCVIEQFKIAQRERLIGAVRRDRRRGARAARRRTVPAARRRARQRAERRPARPGLTPRAHGRGADRVASCS